MLSLSGSLNSRGFQQQIQNQDDIPYQDHLTYSGVFNEIYYEVGQKAKNLIELEIGYGKIQDIAKSQNISNQFIGLFAKSSKDGEPRDDTVLHAVLLLDISGSMSGTLINLSENQNNTRLDLAKTAIEMLLAKMQPNDCLSLITFQHDAKTILPLTQVNQIQQKEFLQNLKQIKAGGGTTISSGLIEAQKQFAKQQTCQNIESRIIMLTDVCDNSVAEAGNFIQQLIKSQIHTTIVGISDEFQSEYCEKLINVEGFNYFCAIQETDLIKFLIDNFAYTLFPFASDMEISIQSQEIENIEVFGTPDHKEMQSYQTSELKAQNKIIVTRSKSLFPSPIEIDDANNVKMEGGLILCKTILKQEFQDFKLLVNLQYKDRNGVKYSQDYKISSQADQQQDFYSIPALKDGIGAFQYVNEVKQIFLEMENQDLQALQKNRQLYIQKLQSIKSTLPISLIENLNDTIKFVSKYRQ